MALLAIIGILAVFLGGWLVQAWLIMIIWGALASNFHFGTISFGVACLISLALGIIGGFFKSSSK